MIRRLTSKLRGEKYQTSKWKRIAPKDLACIYVIANDGGKLESICDQR